MKKIKIFTMLICIVTVICAIAVSSNAKWWDENPFTDVKSSHWYYDAVRIANENGIFNGTSENKYSPSVKMTRAMLVKALANLDGYTEAYKGTTPFTDVKSNHWFATAVEWAYETKVTSGKTDTTFAPNENITREQLAAMLYRYAEYKGMEITNTKEISSFPDASKVSEYAVKNFEWAYGNGIINGSVKDGKTYLNPRNPATRAECATMFSKYLYLEPVYEINGNDLSLYTIVYSDAEAAKVDSINDAAQALQKYIRSATGIALPVMSDSSPVGEYEILLGKTTREVKADLGTLTSDMEYICAVEGNTLVIMGADDSTKLNGNGDRSHHNINGTLNAVYNLLEEKFGYDFYYDGEGVVSNPDPVISLEDGYYHTDIQAFESVSMYINSEGAECYLHNNYYSEWGCNVPHQLVHLINGGWKNGYTSDPTAANICYSDPENMEKALINTRELLESRPQLNLVGLMQTDSSAICRCSRCAAIYTADGRAGTIIRLVNYVAENLEEEYPDVKYASISYNWSSKPPKSDLSYHKNVILYHAPITVCPTHAYTDTSCEYNDSFPDNIKTWSEKASKFYVWDYTGSFGDCMAPCPDLDSIHTNVKAFYDSGVRGVFLNGRMGNTSDMYGLRAYLFTQLYRDPLMSEEEYYYHMNGYLKTFYGDGWSYIREYIDKLADIADQKCSGTHVDIDKLYDFDLVYKAGKELDALWDKAEAAAKTETHLANIQKHRLTWTYLWQSARYEKDYTNGDAASREEYTAVSAKLSEDIVKFNVKWDGKGDEPSGDLTVPPYQW